jgi:hypothetical protein
LCASHAKPATPIPQTQSITGCAPSVARLATPIQRARSALTAGPLSPIIVSDVLPAQRQRGDFRASQCYAKRVASSLNQNPGRRAAFVVGNAKELGLGHRHARAPQLTAPNAVRRSYDHCKTLKRSFARSNATDNGSLSIAQAQTAHTICPTSNTTMDRSSRRNCAARSANAITIPASFAVYSHANPPLCVFITLTTTNTTTAPIISPHSAAVVTHAPTTGVFIGSGSSLAAYGLLRWLQQSGRARPACPLCIPAQSPRK